MTDTSATLQCGCHVTTARDFLGRLVGTIVTRGEACTREDHQPGKVLAMPGRDAARQD